MKKFISLFLTISMCITLAACADGGKTGPSAKPDPLEVVVSIGDETVNYALYESLYNSYLSYMQQSGYNPLANLEELNSFQDWIVDFLVTDVVTLYNAKQNGFTLSEEDVAQMESQADEELKSIYDEYMNYAQEDNSNDPSKTVEEYFNDYMEVLSMHYTGKAMTFEEYSEQYRSELEKTYIITEYKAQVCEEFEVANEDITGWYSEHFNADSSTYASSPAQYKVDQEYFEKYFGIEEDADPPTYAPAGYSRIMDIVVAPEGELSEEYTERIKDMDELYSEYCELSFDDALNGTDENSTRIAEILDEYREIKALTDAEFEEYTAAAAEKINQAYLELEGGAEFSEVMLKYTEDPFVVGDDETEPSEAFRTVGRVISTEHESPNDWSATLKAQFGELEIGEYSGVFLDEDNSYHIIYYASDIEEGEIPLNSIYDSVEIAAKASSDERQWADLVEDWKDDPDLYINTDVIRLLGMDALPSEAKEEETDEA